MRERSLTLAKIPRLFRPLAEDAFAQGWEIHLRRGGHLAWRAPDGRTVFTPSSPSDGGRGMKQTRTDLRRAGLIDRDHREYRAAGGVVRR